MIELINTFEPVIIGVMLISILSWIITATGLTATSSRAWSIFWGLFLVITLMVGLLSYRAVYEAAEKFEAIENCAETDLYVLDEHEGTRLLRIYDCHHVEMP